MSEKVVAKQTEKADIVSPPIEPPVQASPQPFQSEAEQALEKGAETTASGLVVLEFEMPEWDI